MTAGAIQVRGIAQVQRAFKLAGTGIDKDLREGLKSAAEPVRGDAQQLALTRISGMARVHVPWWQMRTGVVTKSVYVAPVQRGVKSRGRHRFRRPKFADLLLGRAMVPALEQNTKRVEKEVEDVLADLARTWGQL